MSKEKQKPEPAALKQTPMLRQYLELKARYPDCILFFRLGDFYEMFFEDAEVASKALDITLTSRAKGGEGYPMCGVPHHSANGYIARLIELGFKVAVCDQMEDPSKAKGIVRRDVTRVVSAGMITEPEGLDASESNFLAALCPGDPGGFGLAYLDVSTGDFRFTGLVGEENLLDELARVRPRELLVPPELDPHLARRLGEAFRSLFVKESSRFATGAADAGRDFDERFGDLGPLEGPLADGLRAARVVWGTVADSVPGALEHFRRVQPYAFSDHLVLDAYSQVNLELVRTLMEGKRRGSLLGVIDRTVTPMGARLLAQWLLFPLVQVEAITRRADAVEQLVDDAVARADLRLALSEIRDLERLLAKVSVGQANPRDLGALRDSLGRLPGWRARIEASGTECALLKLLGPLDDQAELYTELDAALVEGPPPDLAEGGAIRAGYHQRLDELVALSTSGRDVIAALEGRERERTGIGSLKVRYNRVFGYYIEVTKPNLHLVPDDYRRKQTTANTERFETEELKKLEEQVLNAQQDRVTLERELVDALVARVRAAADRLKIVAYQVAVCDVVATLAELAAVAGYCRPVVDDGDGIEIGDGRHPVVEQLMREERFVPNDVRLDSDHEQLLIITGPNMAGKSTTIRQVALLTILAQMGSFVPARAARIGVVDRIFTRIGAADNLARGQSTFMVEMTETAHILRHASRRSLIILDEIGRGTSTFDGLSIAWAVAEYIHDRIGARTLFATHYHQLSDLARTKERVVNYTISVKEWNDQIIFLRRLVRGVSSRSYGIQVGKLAGLPSEVIRRAREILGNLEVQEFDELGAPRLSRSSTEPRPRSRAQLQLFAPTAAPQRSEIEEQLRAVELEVLSPLEALNLLHRWKGGLK